MSSFSLPNKNSCVALQTPPTADSNRLLDSKFEQIALLKKIIAYKLTKVSDEKMSRLDYLERLMKIVRKQAKDKALGDVEVNTMFHGLYDDIEELFQESVWEFRADRTDFESFFFKTKMNDKNLKYSKFFQEILTKHVKKPQEVLLNCPLNVIQEQKNSIQNFTVNTLRLKAIQMLNSLPFACESIENIPAGAIQNLVTKIACSYNIVPYHNFSHGFLVFMGFYNLTLLTNQMKGMLTDLQQFFVSIACLSHDISHNGNNTLFEINTESVLAVNYGHFSVMEKMHLSRTMEILERNPSTNHVFAMLTPEQKIRARKVVSKAILATDMSQHYIFLDKIKDKVPSKTDEGREVLIQLLTHACDIDNPTLNYQSYLSWAQLVCIEFNDQTIKEELWKVEVTEFLKFDSLPYFYKNQLSFANSIVLPIWKGLSVWFPEIQSYPDQIKENVGFLTEAMRRKTESSSHHSMEKYLSFRLAN